MACWLWIRASAWCQRARRLLPCECESESRKSRKIEDPNEKIISSVPTGANEKLRKDPEGQKIQKEKTKVINHKIQRQGQAHGQNTACKAWSKWFLFFLLLHSSHACEYTRMTCTGPPNGPPSSVDCSTGAPWHTLAANATVTECLEGDWELYGESSWPCTFEESGHSSIVWLPALTLVANASNGASGPNTLMTQNRGALPVGLVRSTSSEQRQVFTLKPSFCTCLLLTGLILPAQPVASHLVLYIGGTIAMGLSHLG